MFIAADLFLVCFLTSYSGAYAQCMKQSLNLDLEQQRLGGDPEAMLLRYFDGYSDLAETALAKAGISDFSSHVLDTPAQFGAQKNLQLLLLDPLKVQRNQEKIATRLATQVAGHSEDGGFAVQAVINCIMALFSSDSNNKLLQNPEFQQQVRNTFKTSAGNCVAFLEALENGGTFNGLALEDDDGEDDDGEDDDGEPKYKYTLQDCYKTEIQTKCVDMIVKLANLAGTVLHPSVCMNVYSLFGFEYGWSFEWIRPDFEGIDFTAQTAEASMDNFRGMLLMMGDTQKANVENLYRMPGVEDMVTLWVKVKQQLAQMRADEGRGELIYPDGCILGPHRHSSLLEIRGLVSQQDAGDRRSRSQGKGSLRGS